MRSKICNRTIAALLVTSSFLCFAPGAVAQSADEDAQAALGDIIVSARRRDETLQQTPIAITAVNAAQLEAKATLNIGDIQGTAPNLIITQQNSSGATANMSIRGLAYADNEKSQEPTVGVVVDGVFIGTNTGAFLDFFDIQQLEVLRGPQGTLFGRNTIGGVISITRSKPKMEWGAKVEGSYGSYNTWSGRAVVNIPIIEGTLGIKPFYFHTESDGYYRHGITGERAGGNNNDNFGVALGLVLPDFDATLTIEKQVQKFNVVNSNITQTGELFCALEPVNECNRNTTTDLYTVFNSPAFSRYSAPAGTLEMNANVGNVKLTSISSWRESKESQTQDFDASSADLYFTRRDQNYRQFSQEVRAAGNLSDTFDYVVGAYFFDSKYNLVQDTRFFGAPTPQQQVGGKSTSYAVFGDFNWAFMDNFRLSFGGRYTADEKSLTNASANVLLGQGKATFRKFTPKIGVDYRPNDDAMVYASWSRGYRSGGFSPRAQTALTASIPYEPETVDSYEVGAKLDLFDRKLLLGVAGFYAKYDALQQSTTIPGGPRGNQTIVANVGSATIKGVEADFTARPIANLKLTGAMGLLWNKAKNFVVSDLNLAGTAFVPYDYSANNLIYAPKFNASIGANYTVPISDDSSVILDVGYRYIAPYDQQVSKGPLSGDLVNGPIIVNGNDPRVRSDRQNLLDASIRYNFKVSGVKAHLAAFGRNILDDRGPTAAFTVAGLWSFASAREPAVYGGTLGIEF